MNSSALLREADIRGWVSVAAKFMRSSVPREHGRPLRWAKLDFRKVLAAVFSGAALSVASVGIENEDGAVSAGDLDRLAGSGALVEEVETRLRIVVGDPFADRLPRWLDGFEGFDVEGRVGWWRKVDDTLPEAVETKEELDFAGADDGADALHGGLAAGALERVGAPDGEDEVAPERAHGAGGNRGRRRDDGRFRYGLFFATGFRERG
jgi:hypothetical protein